jgi:dipeptidyl-peptidase-4
VVQLLQRQGITVERLAGTVAGPLEAFLVDSIVRDPLFEGHHPVRVEGHWSEGGAAAGTGWFRVPTAQPLGRFAAYLLEPASEDGVVAWNLVDTGLAEGRPYPILRSRRTLTTEDVAAPAAPTRRTHAPDR